MKTTVIAAAATAAIAAAAVAHGQAGPSTLHLTQAPPKLSYVDAPPKQGFKKPSAGDVFIIVGKDTGDDTGVTHLVCTVTGSTGSDCHGTARLSKGSLTIAGFSAFKGSTTTYVITGGTGAYAGKRGVAVVTGENTDDVAITFAG